MLFSSVEFFVFFVVVFIYRWYIHPFLFQENESGTRLLHIFLLAASYFFYMSWKWIFGGLIFISTYIDYFLAIKIVETENQNRKKLLLYLSLFLNLICILGFFKYYNFFGSILNSLAGYVHFREIVPVLDIVLPAGVSFFTFQSMSYTIDVYRGVVPCERSFVRFALFVSFFPQLVAGPIVTAKTFLPQLFRKVPFTEVQFKKAVRYFFMGYFKKIIISDNISPIADKIYANPEMYSTEAIWLAAILVAIQVYCDFSGYSDMAYASALFLGYELPENFRIPFIGTSVTDLWRRWHISLSSWLRDYVYFSLGGSRVGYFRHKLNLWITMFAAGFWHGANWTFVIWGSFQGFLLAVESIFQDWKKKKFGEQDNSYNYLSFIGNIYTLFIFITVGIFFRAESVNKALLVLGRMFTPSPGELRPYMVETGLFAISFIAIGHILGYKIFEKKKEIKIHPAIEFAFYIVLVFGFSAYTNDNEAPFIYFQF